MTQGTITRLIAIRHGETEWNSEGRFQGHLNSVLSAGGLAQAQALGARLARERFDILISSDLGRTLQTASAIAMQTGHEIVVDSQLRERHMGVFQGLTPEEVQARHPQEFARFKSRDSDFDLQGGESINQLYRRTVDCFTRLALNYPGQTLAIVTHGGVLAMLYRHAANMALDAPRNFPIHNTGINRFQYSDGGWEMQGWGDIGHLQDSGLDDLD